MDQMGLEDQDLTPYIGARSKVSEVLNLKRGLSLAMIRKLSSGLNIPAESLIQDYHLSR
jgi:HTH-type transcriptional regulator/antitoxin HigA